MRVASQPPVVSEATAMVPPFAGGAVFAALPSVFAGSCQVFLSLSGSVFPCGNWRHGGNDCFGSWVGGCCVPVDFSWWSGRVFFFFVYGCAGCRVWVPLGPSTSAAGAVTVGAVTAMPAGAGGLPAPLRCMVCLACLARRGCLVCLACLAGLSLLCQGALALVGVAVAQPVVGSTGETWLRWRFPSPMASSRRSGSFGGHPWYEVLDQVLPPASGRSFIGEAPQRGSSCRLVDCCLASLWAGVCGLP